MKTAKTWVEQTVKESEDHTDRQIKSLDDEIRSARAKGANQTYINSLVKKANKLSDKKKEIKESIVTNLISKNLIEANKIFKEQMAIIAKKKLLEHKKMIAAQLDEDKKDDGFVNQYTDNDLDRVQKGANYLFQRSLRKGSKFKYAGQKYGIEDLHGGAMSKRTVGIDMERKRPSKTKPNSVEIKAKPEVERTPKYRELLAKRMKRITEGEVVQFPQRKKQLKPANDQISKPKLDNYDEKNSIHSWHNSRVLSGNGETTTSTDAYESYLNFCNDHGHEPKSMFPFVKEWMDYSGHPMQKQNGRVVHTVKIQDPPGLKEAPELKIVPPKKRTAADFADGMSDYSKSGAGIKAKQGIPQGNLKVVKK